jgi:DNA repair exonuclease SbcCD ATPase subunit
MYLLYFLFITPSIQAIEVAPRISDREIIQSLAEIKAEIKSNQKISNQRFEGINQRFDNVNQRFDNVSQRFESLEKSIDKRLDFISNLMLVMLAGVFGLIGFIIWDRKTALRPLEKRLDNLEKYLQHDLELRHEKGSLLTRLVKSLQDLAKQDENLATVLRSYSLL